MKRTMREKVNNAIRKRLRESLDENTIELIRAYESERDEAKKIELKYALCVRAPPVLCLDVILDKY